MNSPHKQHIVRHVLLLTAVGLIAGVTVAALISRTLHGLRQQRVQATESQEALQTFTNQIRDLTTRARHAMEFEQDLEDEQWGKPVLVLRDQLDAMARQVDDPKTLEILAPMRQDAAALNALARMGEQWRTRYRAVHDDIVAQRSIAQARQAIADLRAQLMQLAGERRLEVAVAVHRRFGTDVPRLMLPQDTSLVRHALTSNQELLAMETDLAHLARLVEVLNGETSGDRFADLLANQFNPLLVSLRIANQQLKDARPGWTAIDQGVDRLTRSILGEGAVIDLQEQQVRRGDGGLFGLRVEATALHHMLQRLLRQRDDIVQKLNQGNAALAAHAQQQTLTLAESMERHLSLVRHQILLISLIVGAVFLSLAMVVTRGIRSQVNAIEHHAAALANQIAQRESAEHDVQRLKGLQETILNSILDGILWVDKQGAILFENPAAARLLGWNPMDLIGKSAHNLMHHSRHDGTAYDRADCPICLVLADGKTRRIDDEAFWRKDGTAFPVEYTTMPVLDYRGQIEGAIVVFADITQRKAAEAKLQQSQKLEVIGQLAAGIAHEINTPAQYVSDNITFLRDNFEQLLRITDHFALQCRAATAEHSDQHGCRKLIALLDEADYPFLRREIPSAINESLEGLGRVTTIVRAMKDFSHPGSDSKEATDLNRSILSTIEVCRNRWKYVADLQTDLAPDLPLVHCLVAEFNQVVLNLIVNAADAIGEMSAEPTKARAKGLIRVSTRLVGDMVEVRIADNGKGIPPAAQSHIFEPFFTTKAVGKGTGQGLALSWRVVVKDHGGKIFFETRQDVGTTFVIQLPIQEQSKDKAQAA